MSNADAQIDQRRANLAAIEALGFPAYPHQFATTHTVGQLVDAHAATPADDARGAAASRPWPPDASSASAASARPASSCCRTAGAALQVYVRQDALSEREFQLAKLLDFGDIIGVAGHLFRTKTNELSIWASSLTFLAKCFLPLPEKWHGLQDVETRYRQRYLDLIVNPDVRRVFELRSRTVAAIRDVLTARGFLEVETPMMQPIAGGALARPFVTHHNALDMQLYLRIAPELYLKRLVVGGVERVFEINRNFRNEGISTQHNPEFTMLEFYRAYVDYQTLMAFTEELLSTVAERVTGGTTLPVRRPRDLVRRALPAAVAAARGGRGGHARGWAGAVTVEDLRTLDGAAAVAKAAAPRGAAGRRRRQDRHRGLRAAVAGVARAADLRLRLPDRGLAAVEAAGRRSRHGGALRALHRRLRGGQRLQRAQRSGRAAPPLRGAAGRPAPRATTRRTRWTRTTCARSSTACRRRAAKASASTGW